MTCRTAHPVLALLRRFCAGSVPITAMGIAWPPAAALELIGELKRDLANATENSHELRLNAFRICSAGWSSDA